MVNEDTNMSNTNVTEYTANNIITMKNLEMIRHRPKAFVVATDTKGQFHAIKELIDNVIDEMEECKSGMLEIIYFKDIKNDSYQVMIKDNGRGIPIDTVIPCFTVINTSGKYNTDSYKYSGGQLGIGAKAAAGLSKYMRVFTVRPKRMATFCIKDANVYDYIEKKTNTKQTGTTIYFELDKKFFEEIEIGLDYCLNNTVELLKKFKLFMHNANFLVKESNKPLTNKIWDSNITFEELNDIYYQDILINAKTIYNSDFNVEEQKLDYLKTLWNIDSDIIWNLNLNRAAGNYDNLEYQIQLYLPKRIRTIGYVLSMVNHIVISDITSSHIEGLQDAIKEKLVHLIEDNELKKFFLEYYKLPIFSAIYIKYAGAQLSGTTKTAFIDKVFSKQYINFLREDLNKIDAEVWEEVFGYIASNLETMYNQFFNKSVKIKTSKFSLLDLNYPTKFNNCKYRENSELFIVEGDSAGGGITNKRNSDFQAVIKTRGKPINAMLTMNERRASLKILQNNKLYQDIIKIIGIHPDETDMSKCNFRRILLTMDGDQDGQHILSLHLGNLYILNPNLILNGMVYVIKPPLYTLNLGKKGKIFLQDKMTLIDTCINLIYNKTLDIKLLNISENKVLPLSDDSYRDMCFLIIKIGELIYEFVDKLAIKTDKLGIDRAALILEKLIYVSNFILPEQFNLNKIKEVFLGNMVRYDSASNILIISIGDIDINILLHDFNKLVYDYILPLLTKMRWKDICFLVSTKYTDLYDNQPFSIVGVYNLFKSLDSIYTVDRFKGLGEMPKPDLKISCIDPETRVSQHVVNLGDIEKIFALLGTNIESRKKILFD